MANTLAAAVPAVKSKKPAKVNPVVLFETMLNLMELEKGEATHWPICFRIYEPEPGKRLPVVVTGNEVAVTCLSHVTNSIMGFARSRVRQDGEDAGSWRLTQKQCVAAAEYWLSAAQPIGDVAQVAWADEPDKLAWRHLPWSGDESGEAPTWMTFLDTMECNKEAVMAWVGSLFEEKADISTYLWLYGDGANGKSRFFAFLRRTFGTSFASNDFDSFQSRWWAAMAIGKRVIVFPDTNSCKVVTSGRFKSVTGGDAIFAEQKHGQPFTVTLSPRIAIGSNNLPELSGETADLRRCIFVRLAEIPEHHRRPEVEVDEALWREGGVFIAACRDFYRRLCPEHGKIPFDKSETMAIAGDVEAPFAHICNHLTFKKDEALRGQDLLDLIRGLFGRVDNRFVSKFQTYLERNYGIRRVKRENGNYYPGIKLNLDGQTMKAGRMLSVAPTPQDTP